MLTRNDFYVNDTVMLIMNIYYKQIYTDSIN